MSEDTTTVPAPSCPAWARGEAVAVQDLIVLHRLTPTQFRVLRGFAGATSTTRGISHSVARALRGRGLGEIDSKISLGHGLTREHPQARFTLNATGRVLVDGLAPSPA